MNFVTGIQIKYSNFSKTLEKAKDSASSISKSTETLKKVFIKRIDIKKKSFTREKLFKRRKLETSRRKEKEQKLETIPMTGKIGKSFSGILQKASSPFSAIMNTLGLLALGWLINNLPSIIKFVKDLYNRVVKIVDTIKSFISNLGNWFKNIGGVITAVKDNITNLDFTDSKGKLKNALEKLDKSFESMKNDIEEGKRLLTTPLGQEVSGGSTGGGGDLNAADIEADTPEEKAFIATVRELEGTSHAEGYNTWFGGRSDMDLSQMTVSEVVAEQKRRLSAGEATYGRLTSAAVGAGQFMKPEQTVMAMGLDPNTVKYTPELQNKMILFQAQWARGINPSKKLDENDMRILGGEWASFTPQYGQTTRTASQSLSVYQKNLKEAGGGGSGGKYSYGSGSVVEYLTGDRSHPNFEYNGHGRESNYHEHIAFRTLQDKERAKAALRAAGIQIGSEYRPGDPGWHGANLAIDVPGAQWGGSGAIGQREYNGSAKVRSVLAQAGFSGSGIGQMTTRGSFSSPPMVSPDLGYPQGSQQAPIIIIDEEAPQPVQSAQMQQTPQMIVINPLNRFIKNKMLLDLAYT